MAAETSPSQNRPRVEFAVGVAAISLGIIAIVAVPQLRHCVSLVAHGKFTGLRIYIRSLNVGGLALLLGLMLVHAVVWYPSEIVTTTAGYVYGFIPGLLIATAGWLLCALVSYALGRSVGRPVLQRLLGRRFESLTLALENGGIPLLLSARLIPVVPFALLGYAAGATRIKVWRFTWTTVVGYLPLTAAVAYLGSQAKTFSTSNPVLWVVVIGLVALLVGEHVLRIRRKHQEADGAQPLHEEAGTA